jgi:hypothetical protein
MASGRSVDIGRRYSAPGQQRARDAPSPPRPSSGMSTFRFT